MLQRENWLKNRGRKYKQAKACQRRLKTILGRTVRDITRKATDDQLSGKLGKFLSMAEQVLNQKREDKKLSPKDLQGANFTITSLGSIGGTAFTPLVNWPQVAILGISPATMQPVWNGQSFDPRLMLPLSLSYDHRVINGADAARFTNKLSKILADIRTILL